jgi:hypothetical protein
VEPGDRAEVRSCIRENPVLKLSMGTIERKETEAARTDRNPNDLVARSKRKTHEHDCLQSNARLDNEAAAEPTQSTGPDQADSFNSFVES